ncbi:MAG: geranylgeranyl reductase family protein [Patescibacteria group bacterium]
MIIIGAGPAGSSAAQTLATHGLKTCIIDKATFPRDKLCGGLLTLRSKKIFEEIFKTDLKPAIDFVSRGVRFYYKNRFLNSASDYKDIFFVQRRVFDNLLLDLACESGVTRYLGVGVKTINFDNSNVTLLDGTTLSGKFIVGADGVNSYTARSLFKESFNKENLAYALEVEIPRDEHLENITEPEIYFGVVKWGYGWVFPKRHSLAVGLAGLYRKNFRIDDNFKNFFTARFGISAPPPKGHYIPFGNYRRTAGRMNVLLCGDAAGLVEPITGEGISFAMQSGHFAALSIIEASSAGKPQRAYEYYQPRYKNITRIFDHANLLRYLIFPKIAESLFIKALPQTESVPQKHMDLMAGEIDYRRYELFLLRKVCSAFLKKIFGGKN